MGLIRIRMWGNGLSYIDKLGLNGYTPTEPSLGAVCIECLFIPAVRIAFNICNSVRSTKNSINKPSIIQRYSIDENKINHIFRNSEGHLKDNSIVNRNLLQNTANNPKNLLGSDKYGNQWFSSTQENGSQVWTQVRNNSIINGGVNSIPKTFNPQTGLSSPVKPGGK